MCTTTFCQGKTQRWALAWTFQPNIRLKVKIFLFFEKYLREKFYFVKINNSNEPKKIKSPLKLILPESSLTPYDFQSARFWLLDVLRSLEVDTVIIFV